MSQESFATKRSGGLYGFQSSLRRISDFESHIARKDLSATSQSHGEWRRVTVIAGWIFNETVIGESVKLELGLPYLDSNTCCVWVELLLTLSDEYVSEKPATKQVNDSLLAWNNAVNSSFSHSTRVRELSSLTSAAALQILPRLSSGLELYYIYCWEGNTASVMSKAKAVQSALLLERALLTAFYESPGIDRFISRRILDSGAIHLFPLPWLDNLSPNELRVTANSILNENRLLYRLISQAIKPAPVTPAQESLDDTHRFNSGWPPPSTSADQSLADIRMMAEQIPQSLPSKRVLTSLLLPAGPFQNDVTLSADGRAEIRVGLDSIRHEMRPPEEVNEAVNPSSNIVTMGGSMSLTPNDTSIFTTRPGSEQHLTRPINRPTLPQLKSLNLHRRRPAEKREDNFSGSGGPLSESPPLGVPYDSHRTSSLSATPHDNEEVVSTQRSVKARKLDSNNVAPSRTVEEASGPPVLLGSHSSSSSLSSEADDDDVNYGGSESLSPSSSSIASSPQRVPRLVAKGQGGGGFMRLPPTLPQRSTLGVPELGLTGSARHEGSAADAGPPSRRSPEVDRNSALAKYRFICSEILEDQLYLAGEGVASSLDILQKHRITHIVNSAGDTCPNYFPGKFNYLTFVLQDSRLTNETLEAVLFFALDFIQRAIDTGGRLLVHCREGVSRSCTLVCAYLMCSRHITFQAALDHVRSVREMCNPNTGFTFTLLKLGKRLHAAETDGGGSGIGDRKLSRVSLHHLAAPFMVVLGVSLWEPTHQSWMPGGKALSLDPRFYYVLRVHPCIYVWKGSAIPKHMDRLMRKAIDRYISDIKKYEKLPDEVCQAIEVEEGREPEEFWTTLYIDCKKVPSSRVAQNPALDEEAHYLAHEFPHVSVFDMEEWEQQLKKVDDETPKTHTFTFVPPKSTPRTMEAARRSNIRHFGRHDSPLVTGSATHRIEMTPSYAASSRRVRNSLGLATPPESQQRRRFGPRSRLSQSGESPQAMMSASQSAGLTAHSTQHEGSLEEPEEDYQSGFTRRSLLSVPQQSIAIGIRRPSNGAGKEGKFETGVLYAFTFPTLDEGVTVDDDEILTDRSNDVILFVLFGQSALTPVQLPPLDDEVDESLVGRTNNSAEDPDGLYSPGGLDEDTDRDGESLFDSRAAKRNYTVPPIVLEPRLELPPSQQPLATAIPAGKRPATAGAEFESLSRTLQQEAKDLTNDVEDGDSDKEWETTIWLWEGSDTDIQSDDYRDSIISSFCKIHSLDPHLLWVYSEKEGAETSKFLEMLYLL